MPFIPPVFFKARDIIDFTTLGEYEVYESVGNTVGPGHVIACQRIGGLWRIYVKTTDDRIKLLSNKLTIRGQLVAIYNDNPFRSGQSSPDEKTIKLTIKDIPLSKENASVEAFLQSRGVTLTRSIQYGKIRNPTTKELTDCYSGDRIMYVKPFDQDIPRVIYIGSTRARLFYDGQKLPNRDILCTNCFSTSHYRSKCTSPKACHQCRSQGHKPGDAVCEAIKSTPHKKVTAFQGADDVLSNFYPCEIKCHGIIAKSSEHAYNYVKAIRRGSPELAQAIKDAPTALLAKQVTKKLPFDPKWKDEKVQVMKDILSSKCEQVPEFKKALIDSKQTKLVEAVPWDFFWSTGLSKQDTLNTKSKFWFGSNQMGLLLTEIRDSIPDFQTQKQKTRKQNKKQGAQCYDSKSHMSDSSESE